MKQWKSVAIVGVGLIGGSIGLRLRSRGLAAEVIGIGRRPEGLREAADLGAVSRFSTDLSAVAKAELVVVCTPVETVAGLVRKLAAHCPPEAVITDVGSTKEAIVEELLELGADGGPSFVGSHPLAGSEKTGVAAATPDLFAGRTVVITPRDYVPGSPPAGAVAVVRGFWLSLGASVRLMSPGAHDQAVAAVSHLPHVVASVLAAGTATEELPLVATGWLDTTRVAAGDVELWRQILAQNRGHVLKSIDKFAKVLSSFRDALHDMDDARLLEFLEAGKRNRDSVGS